MAFEDIECIGAASSGTPAIPPNGVRVGPRALGRPQRAGGGHVSYIRVGIGAELARAISLTAQVHRLRLLFGTAEDAGKVRVSVDNQAGKFTAKRDKKGNYAVTINAATADGLFALNFAPFTDERCEPIRPANGQPPHFVFKASAEMLAAEEN